LQGEGQEFESPRLHHHRRAPRATATEQIGSKPRNTSSPPRDLSVLQRAPDPCPSPMNRPRTSGSLGGGTAQAGSSGGSALRGPGRTLTTGYVRQIEDLRFRRVVKEMIPIDPVTATDRLVRGWRGSSYKGHGVDALAPRADEGRARLRKAPGSREGTVIRRCPNGETRLGLCPVTPG
jgi:hypothetical protein